MCRTNRLRFRGAMVDDVTAISSLFKQAFAPRLHEFLLFCRKGYKSYIRDQISIQDKQGESFYRVAEVSNKNEVKTGEIAGAIELRRFPDTLFVNLIAVADEFRNMGHGRELLFHALETADGAPCKEVHLDVLSSNEGAKRFYARLGFTCTGTSLWIKVPPAPTLGVFEPVIRGFPIARAALKEFGFGQFQLDVGKKVFHIGLFGDHWLRVNHEEVVDDGAIQTFLRRCFPDRDIFAILPRQGVASALENTPFHIDSTERLQIGCSELLKRLNSGLEREY